MSKTITSLADLVPDDRNANLGTPRGRGLVETSLQRYGAGRSILVDRNGKVIAGNKTSEAAAAIGMEGVVVVQTTGDQLVVVQRTDLDLDEDTAARELAISDNRSSEIGLQWDTEVLAELGAEIDLSTFWTKDEIGLLLEQDVTSGGGDEAPEVQDGPTRVQPGELWQLGRHRLLCGDSTKAEDVGRLMQGERARGAITSPPYAEQRKSQYGGIPADAYLTWWQLIQENTRNLLLPDGSFFINIKPHCEDGERVLYVLDLVLAMKREWGWAFVDEFSWVHEGIPGSWPNRLKNRFEPIYHFALNTSIFSNFGNVKHKSTRAGTYAAMDGTTSTGNVGFKGMVNHGLAYPGNVLEINHGVDRDDDAKHPAKFPVSLPEFFMNAFSIEGDIWYEPFGGSGSTLIAGERQQRRVYSIELMPRYCDVILTRWESETGLTAERIDD